MLNISYRSKTYVEKLTRKYRGDLNKLTDLGLHRVRKNKMYSQFAQKSERVLFLYLILLIRGVNIHVR